MRKALQRREEPSHRTRKGTSTTPKESFFSVKNRFQSQTSEKFLENVKLTYASEAANVKMWKAYTSINLKLFANFTVLLFSKIMFLCFFLFNCQSSHPNLRYLLPSSRETRVAFSFKI